MSDDNDNDNDSSINNLESYPYNSTVFNSYIDADLSLINNTEVWQVYKQNSTTGDICYYYKQPNDPLWYIKLVGIVQLPTAADTNSNNSVLANISDLLDTNIHQRQSEWHELYISGQRIHLYNKLAEIYYFQYKSPLCGVSPRDCCYLKLRRNLETGTGFILSYRSINIPISTNSSNNNSKFVRTIFTGAHLIESIDNSSTASFRYTYLQRADPGGWINRSLSNRPQCKVIMKEINGVREAMNNPILSTVESAVASTAVSTTV